MFQDLAVFKTAHAMAMHAGQKQAVTAQNVANADTPGYIARDLPDFVDTFAPAASDQFASRATRASHLHGAREDGSMARMTEDISFAAPDGNTVSIESEMLRATEAKRQHDRALAIYKSAMNILRSSLGRQ